MVHLTNESGYDFIVTRWTDEKIVGGYYRIETAVAAIKAGWQCELRWDMSPTDPLRCNAFCMATGKCVASVHKVPMSSIPLALVL